MWVDCERGERKGAEAWGGTTRGATWASRWGSACSAEVDLWDDAVPDEGRMLWNTRIHPVLETNDSAEKDYGDDRGALVFSLIAGLRSLIVFMALIAADHGTLVRTSSTTTMTPTAPTAA